MLTELLIKQLKIKNSLKESVILCCDLVKYQYICMYIRDYRYVSEIIMRAGIMDKTLQVWAINFQIQTVRVRRRSYRVSIVLLLGSPLM